MRIKAQDDIRKEFKEILADYKYNPDIMSNEDERVAALKEIIFHKLSVPDRNVILLYIDLHSYRKLAKRLRLSHTSCGKQVHRIRQIILEEYGKMKRQ